MGWAASWTEGIPWKSAKSSFAAAVTFKHCFHTTLAAEERRPPCKAFEIRPSPHWAGPDSHLSWLAPLAPCQDQEDAAGEQKMLSFFTMLWSHKISKYPVLFVEGVFPENVIFSTCSTRGCFNYTYLHMRKHTTYVFCGGCTHTCQAVAFSLTIYDMGLWLDF